MNNVKLLHMKCCFFQFFNSPVALKNIKKSLAPQEKVDMTPLILTSSTSIHLFNDSNSWDIFFIN